MDIYQLQIFKLSLTGTHHGTEHFCYDGIFPKGDKRNNGKQEYSHNGFIQMFPND